MYYKSNITAITKNNNNLIMISKKRVNNLKHGKLYAIVSIIRNSICKFFLMN